MATFPDLWVSFWSWVDTHPASAFLFRGQADKSPIVPKIGRTGYNWAPAREKTYTTHSCAQHGHFFRCRYRPIGNGSLSPNTTALLRVL